MKRPLLMSPIILACALAAQAYDIKIVGRPDVHRVMVPSLAYFGGGVELLVKVQVLDDNAKPVPNTTVTLSATTKDGGLARLRAFGITDEKGNALVRTVFDLPVLSFRASLVPCLVEPRDECGNTIDVDLTRRNDLETSFGFSKAAQGGSVAYSLVGKPNSSTTQDVLGEETDYSVRAKFIRTLFSAGTLAHNTQLFGSVEGGEALSRLDIPLAPKSNSTSIRPGDVDFSLDVVIWSRFQGRAEYAPVVGSGTGYRAFSGAWEQPLSEQFRLAGGYSYYAPRTNTLGEVLGSTKAPMAAVVFEPKAGGNIFTAMMSYDSSGPNIVPDSNQNLRLYPAAKSPFITLSWDFHRGGYAYTTFFVQAGQITTSTPVYGFGLNVTFRQWANLR
jgi:hypothetical protein